MSYQAIEIRRYINILVIKKIQVFSKVIDNWYSKAKRILFKYKEGFFELPILSNSPESIIGSLVKMPFVYHKKQEEIFGTNNPFLKADVYYQEIDNGFWCMYSTASYKENVNYKRVNDDNILSDYYLLFLEINRNTGKSKNALLNGMSYSNSSWVLSKPGVANTHCRFSGSETISMTIFFTEEWLKSVLYQATSFQNSALKNFFDSNAKLVIWPEDVDVAEEIKKEFVRIFDRKLNAADFSQLEWDKFTSKFINIFIDRYSTDNIEEKLLEIAHLDRRKIQRVEKMLLDTIQGDFIGIDKIAQEVGMSPTKLKSNFKLVFGDSIFQFFRKKQLESAQLLLKETEMSVKEIALLHGYQNPSKFTIAYTNYFGVLPSELRK